MVDSTNLYSYVVNSPVNYIDPYGLQFILLGDTAETLNADRIAKNNYAENLKGLSGSSESLGSGVCSLNKTDVPSIRPRELDTLTQVSLGLGMMSAPTVASAVSLEARAIVQATVDATRPFVLEAVSAAIIQSVSFIYGPSMPVKTAAQIILPAVRTVIERVIN